MASIENNLASSTSITFTKIADTNHPLFSNSMRFGFGIPSINDEGTVAFVGELSSTGSGVFTGSGSALTTIADTSGPLSDFSLSTSINDENTVAFVADQDSGGSGIFKGSGGALTTIADTRGSFTRFNPPSINNEGTVAFIPEAGGVSGSGVFIGSGGALTTIADTSGPFSSFSNSRPGINDGGTVAFTAGLDSGESGAFTASDGTFTTIADDSGDPFIFVSS
jgi:hypothetical protein